MTAIRVTARPCRGATGTWGSPACLVFDLVPLAVPLFEGSALNAARRRRVRDCDCAAPVETRDTTAARECPLASGVGGMAGRADVGRDRLGRRPDGERRAARRAPDVDDVQRRMLGQRVPSFK